jgi:hypothetical protein
MGSEKIIIEAEIGSPSGNIKIPEDEWQESDELSETERSGGGFGHTGIKK